MLVQKLRRIYGGVLDGLSEFDFDGKEAEEVATTNK
jgi:hypothetical protein